MATGKQGSESKNSSLIVPRLDKALHCSCMFGRSIVRMCHAIGVFAHSIVCNICRESVRRINKLTIFQITLRLLVAGFAISVIKEIYNDSPVLEIVNLPEEFQKLGYTPDIVARRILDIITEVEATQKLYAKKRLLLPATDTLLPELQLPTANVSLRNAVLYVRQVLDLRPELIVVDVMLDRPLITGDPSTSKTATTKPYVSQLKVIVRRKPGESYSTTNEPFSERSPEDALHAIALNVLAEADPYIFALSMLESKPTDSERYFQRATELDPRDARAYLAWGAVLGDQGKYNEAIAKYRITIDLDSKENAGVAYINWGNILEYQGKFEEAVAKYRSAISVDPTAFQPIVSNSIAIAYTDWGNKLLFQGSYGDAIAKYQMAIAFDPKHTNAYTNWGTILDHQGKDSEAIAKFQKTIEIDPKFANAYYNWGNLLSKQGDLNGAIEKYQKAVEFNPQNAIFRRVLEDEIRTKGQVK